MTATYLCACCHGEFEYGWSDDLATKELEQRFPGNDKQDCAIVCDSCFHGMGLAYGPPEDQYKDIPKPMREIFRKRMSAAEEMIIKALSDNLLYGTPLPH